MTTITATLTFANGETFTATVPRRKFWRSAVLAALPYGTDTYGCTWSIGRTS